MEKINLNDFEKIAPTGGKRSPVLGLSNQGYFRINSAFKIKNDLGDKNSVDIRAKKEDDKLIVIFEFLRDKHEGAFAVSHYARNNSATFSGRSLFSHLGVDYHEIGKVGNLKPAVQMENNRKYFIVEIKLKK